MKRLLGLAAVLLVGTMGVAHAQEYPPKNGITVVVDGDAVPGGSITIEARTFGEDGPVSVTINGNAVSIPLGNVNAGPSGVAQFSTVLPASLAPGTYTLTATGEGADGEPLTVTTLLRVVALANGAPQVLGAVVERSAAGPGSGGAGLSLSKTGASHTETLARVGAGALVAGGLLVLAADRRRSRRLVVAQDALNPQP